MSMQTRRPGARDSLSSVMYVTGYTAALRQTPQYQQLAQAYSTARSSLSQMSQGDYQQLAEAANLRLLMALDKLGLKESYLAMVSRSKQLIADQFHDLVQRPEVQQIYVIGNEIYQQVSFWQMIVSWLVVCLMSQQHASVCGGRF